MTQHDLDLTITKISNRNRGVGGVKTTNSDVARSRSFGLSAWLTGG
jgi:hypothetical protein